MYYPIAPRKPFANHYHNTAFDDPYHWLRQKEWTPELGVSDNEILSYINAENTYAKTYFESAPIQKIYEECLNLVDIDEETYPIKHHGYAYFTKSRKGKNYQEHWRKNLITGERELLFDENIFAKDLDYFRLYLFEASVDNRYIALAYDIDGSERLILKILDTQTQKFLIPSLCDVSGNGLVWLNDTSGFYYQKVDENWRSNQVYKFDFKTETLIFKETDHTNHTSVTRSADDKYLLIYVSDPKDNVVHIQDLNSKSINFQTPFPRRKEIKYKLESANDSWIMLTNDQGPNKRLIAIPKNDLNVINEIFPLEANQSLINFAVFDKYICATKRFKGLSSLVCFNRINKQQSILLENIYSLDLHQNEYNDLEFKISTSSLIQPETTILINAETFEQKIAKTKEIPNYKSDDFIIQRKFTPSKDGEQVPYTLAYKKGTILGNAPVYLYGYGSYGYATDPYFRTTFIPLLERGFIVVLAHIRGGGDLGRAWYESAKLLTKQKTFDDFIACAEDLINQGYTQPKQITIVGGSAGGLLVGTVMNQRPDLFKAVIAMVPFVDVINTMMDDNLPLTPGEYNEWGNPNDKIYFDYMISYSPYDNVKAQDYPALYITSGINDPRVTYWEPTKWAAKLRYIKTDSNILLLETEMGAGHGGPSGKFGYLQEVAKRYAFLVKEYGLS